MKKKILLLGSKGNLATKIINFYKNNKNVSEKFVLIKSFKKIKNKNDLKKIINIKNLNFIINCIGYTDVEKSEKNKKIAYFANSVIPKWLSELLKKNKKIFVMHFSTDHVYSPKKNIKNREDSFKAINIYSKSKLAGENFIKKINSIILRINFFGKFKKRERESLCYWMKENLEQNKIIQGYSNIYFSPLHSSTISKYVFDILKNPYSGIYNLGSKNKISKYEYLKILAKGLKLNHSLIKKHSYSNYKAKVKRPKNMGMNINKLMKKFKFTASDIKFEIKKNINDYKK